MIPVTNDGAQPEILNKRALAIVSRVRDKLTGRDFPYETEGTLSIQRQVELLVQQATSHENLCQCYIGWWVHSRLRSRDCLVFILQFSFSGVRFGKRVKNRRKQIMK